MSEPTVTERQAVERERAAFMCGVDYQRSLGCELIGHRDVRPVHTNRTAAAVARYPHQHVTRPREVKDPDGVVWWSVNGGLLVWCYDYGRQRGLIHPLVEGLGDGCCTPTPERIRLWHDLLNSPTATVPDGE